MIIHKRVSYVSVSESGKTANEVIPAQDLFEL